MVRSWWQLVLGEIHSEQADTARAEQGCGNESDESEESDVSMDSELLAELRAQATEQLVK